MSGQESLLNGSGTGAVVVPSGWPELPASLLGAAVTPGSGDYAMRRSSYMAVGSPELVVVARDEEDVAAAIGYAAAVRRESGERVPVSVRSGGHGISGVSTNAGGIVIDLASLNRVALIEPSSGLFRAGAGASWGDVAPVLAAHDRALTAGNFGDTGVGGLATAGGVGYFARSQGLTLDHVRRVRLATADGRVRWVDEEHEPDLFWAVRGGATQVGIAVDLELDAPLVGSEAGGATIIHQHLQYVVDDLPGFFESWGEWIRSAPREAESFLMVQRAGGGRHVVETRNVWANDDVESAMPTLRTATEELGPVAGGNTVATPYPNIIPTPRQPHSGQQRIKMRDVLVDRADGEFGAALERMLADGTTLVGDIRALGGAVSDVDAAATAWAGRHQELVAAAWFSPAGDDRIDEAFAPIQALGTGLYGAYSSDTRTSAAELAWPGETGERLRAIKREADPERLFDRGLVLPE